MSPHRERLWGLLGGLVGALFGIGSALVAVYGQGERWSFSGAYPAFFETPRLLAYDVYLAGGFTLGMAFLLLSLYFTRFGKHPRTDGCGAGLLGTVLVACTAAILFTRLVALFHA